MPARPSSGRQPSVVVRWRLPLVFVLVVLGAGALGVSVRARAAANQASQVAAVPPGFVGVGTDGPLFGPDTPINFDRQLTTMVANGVQSIRVAFNWAAAQPFKSLSTVPADQRSEFTLVGGRPTNFQVTDMVVGEAAGHGITVLPTVLYTPVWDARKNSRGLPTPRHAGPYGAYLTALIGRYGPRGSFWRANPGIPKLPIRMWQIWNEPNLSYYWHQPFASSYVSLLRTAHAAIKRADPGAQVVLGALTGIAWKSLGTVYRVRGARNLFDVVALNGFTKLPANVILYMQSMRGAMSHFNDGHKPLIATEVSWPSARGKTQQHYDFNTTQAGQARDITAVLSLIATHYVSLRLTAFYYYTWMGDEGNTSTAFNFSGLLGFHDGAVKVKPALAAFRTGVLALEHCRQKGSVATRCAKPAR